MIVFHWKPHIYHYAPAQSISLDAAYSTALQHKVFHWKPHIPLRSSTRYFIGSRIHHYAPAQSISLDPAQSIYISYFIGGRTHYTPAHSISLEAAYSTALQHKVFHWKPHIPLRSSTKYFYIYFSTFIFIFR